jgi:hypothetical protein
MEVADQPNLTTYRSKTKAEDLCRRWSAMQTDLQPFKNHWQEIGEYFMPRKADIISKNETPDVDREARRYDSSPQLAAQIAAGGLMAWTNSATEPWFAYAPVWQLRQFDAVKAWMSQCTELMREYLANSNYYTEAHEDMLNHVVFATSALYCDLDERTGRLRFEALQTGSYAIEENAAGEVDTLFREFELTARQAKEKFGEENLPKKVLEALLDDKKAMQKFKFLHAIYPRPESERPDGARRYTSEGKPFASCYVELSEKHLVKESGFDTFPAPVGRYLKWGGFAYGYGPGFGALPDARQSDHINMMLDIAAEKIVRPPMMAPEDLEGQLSLVAGDVTFINSSISNDRWPKPVEQMGSPAAYQVGQERVKMRKDVLNAWFHVELFNMFATLDQDRRQMTAFEISQRISQKVELIEPAYSRITGEKHTPMLKRLFNLLMEAGMLPQPPPEAVVPVSQFMGIVPPPTVTYSSRMALAISQRHNLAFEQNLQTDIALMQFDPSSLDTYNMPRIRRDRARNAGIPTEWMRTEQEEQAIGQQRAEAQAAQAQLEMMEKGASAVQKAGPMLKEMQQ